MAFKQVWSVNISASLTADMIFSSEMEVDGVLDVGTTLFDVNSVAS